MARFIVHANSPTQPTGYGVQCRHLCDYLTREGHDVAVSVTYGHQGKIGSWTTPSGHEVRLYPSGWLTNSPDTIAAHADHWFEGDPKAGWIITLLDVWCLQHHPGLKDYQVLAWVPIDHFPTPPEVLTFFHNTGAMPVAMSKFGRNMLTQAGLDPAYIPLSVDTQAFKPTPKLKIDDHEVTGRELYRIPEEAFVVGMVAMNKDPFDRKGFNEAFRAFGQFWQDHQEAVLFVHTEERGMTGGLDLHTLAAHSGIPVHALIFTDQYAYRLGLSSEMLAALYSAFDVLLAPSHGEGFGVPLIEAMACGTPGIATGFSSQLELIGPGWPVSGQPWWDQSQMSSYMMPFVDDVHTQLEAAFNADREAMIDDCITFAADYDTGKVFHDSWAPLLAQLEPPEFTERPKMETVDVIVPLMRPENMDRLMLSIGRDPRVHIIVVHDELDVSGYPVLSVNTRKDHTTYAEKINLGANRSDADFILVIGDDVEFTEGWFDAAREVSPFADVIGTNDSEPGRVRNLLVAKGVHADHFFIRRSYIDDEGSSLDGPGVVMPSAYTHWFTDREVIELAKARGVFKMAPECVIIHHHPGYDGDEVAREADPVYMSAVEASEADEKTWRSRVPLVEAHRVTWR